MAGCIAQKTVAIIGGGIAGMSTAARLQAMGIQTVVIEAYKVVGGCAGFYKNSGFSFDVGATTFVDFDEQGVGGQLLKTIGAPPIKGELLPGYSAWLPDKTVHLYRDQEKWRKERLDKLGNSEAHVQFWQLLDKIALGFWDATRKGIKMPMRNLSDVFHNSQVVSPKYWYLARYLNWTTADALKHFGLYNDAPLKGLLGCLIEDTVNSSIDNSPLINSALGVSIRGAGLTRYEGGAYGFWKVFEEQYNTLGGQLITNCSARKVTGSAGNFVIHTNKGEVHAQTVVFAVPPPVAAKMNPDLANRLSPYFARPDNHFGGGIVVFLGVPESEVEGQELLHHQLLQDYSKPQGNGNNMFISISPPGDTESAPAGYRAVVISTHCELEPWKAQNFATGKDYYEKKKEMGDYLISLARRVYPNLATNPVVYEIGTPRTYQKFTKRPFGEVGGVRQTLRNSNQYAIPHYVGLKGTYMVGDGVWPGLGTVACVLGSRIVANAISEKYPQESPSSSPSPSLSSSPSSLPLSSPSPSLLSALSSFWSGWSCPVASRLQKMGIMSS